MAATSSPACLKIDSREVEAVPGMTDLVDSIQAYVSPDYPMNGPRNVAIVFAAAVLALERCGIEPCRSSNESQYFDYRYRGERYRVLLTSAGEPATSSGRTSNEQVSRTSRPTASARKLTRSAKIMAAEQASRRHMQLLIKTLTFDASPTTALLCKTKSGPGDHQTLEEEDRIYDAMSDPTSGITAVLDQLLDRENEFKFATRRVYCAYAQLGDAYRRLVEQRTGGKAPSIETKEFHQVGFVLLVTAMKGWTPREELSQAALHKRLERARKIYMLVQHFGERVLHGPGLTMRLVDRTSFRVFAMLPAARVSRIIALSRSDVSASAMSSQNDLV